MIGAVAKAGFNGYFAAAGIYASAGIVLPLLNSEVRQMVFHGKSDVACNDCFSNFKNGMSSALEDYDHIRSVLVKVDDFVTNALDYIGLPWSKQVSLANALDNVMSANMIQDFVASGLDYSGFAELMQTRQKAQLKVVPGSLLGYGEKAADMVNSGVDSALILKEAAIKQSNCQEGGPSDSTKTCAIFKYLSAGLGYSKAAEGYFNMLALALAAGFYSSGRQAALQAANA